MNQNDPSSELGADRLAVSAAEAAESLGISRAQFYKMLSSGRLPAPVRLGTRSPRWSVAELRDWLDAGCPDRQTWEHMRHAVPEATARKTR